MSLARQKSLHDFYETLRSVRVAPDILQHPTPAEPDAPCLADVDRGQFLSRLFEEITVGRVGVAERVFAVERFCRRYFTHGLTPNRTTDGVWILDPLVNYQARFLQCSEVNRLMLDILAAGDIEGRLVILSAHQAAEARVDGRWVYLDADLFGFAQRPLNCSGEPASVAEIYRDPAIADRLVANSEFQFLHQALGTVFGATLYAGSVFRELQDPLPGRPRIPSIVLKRGSLPDWNEMPGYGWRGTISRDHEVLDEGVLPPWPNLRRAPTPRWAGIEIEDNALKLRWRLPAGPIANGLSIRVDVASRSRDWCYLDWRCDPELRPWWTSSTVPVRNDYDRIDFLPNDDLESFAATGESLEIDLRRFSAKRLYLALVAEDDHGRLVGNKRFMPSEEIVIDLARPDGPGPAEP